MRVSACLHHGVDSQRCAQLVDQLVSVLKVTVLLVPLLPVSVIHRTGPHVHRGIEVFRAFPVNLPDALLASRDSFNSHAMMQILRV